MLLLLWGGLGCGRLAFDSHTRDGGVGDGAIASDGAPSDGAPSDGASSDGAVSDAGDGGGPTPLLFTGCARPPVRDGDPDLPVASVDASPPVTPGMVRTVGAGEDLQAAIDAALPGDVIELAAGARFVGNFELPPKAGEPWIVIRGAATADLPPFGGRIDAASPPATMPVIATPNADAALFAGAGAHHYRLEGIVFEPSPGAPPVNVLVALGSSSVTEAARQTHHVVLDRCIVRGDPVTGAGTGVHLNAAHVAIVGSAIVGVTSETFPTTGIMSWNGPGPFLIANNRIEASGVNLHIGGPAPSIPGLIPADFEICGNHVTRPLTWLPGHPTFAGRTYPTLSLVDVNHARRVLFSGNLLDNTWNEWLVHLRAGSWEPSAVPLVEHVTLAYGVMRRANDVLDVGNATTHSHGPVRVEQVLAYEIGVAPWGDAGRLFLLYDVSGFVARHVTGIPRSHVAGIGGTVAPLTFVDNVLGPTAWGVVGNSVLEGMETLATYSGPYTFTGNVLAGRPESLYPAGNFFPADLAAIGFVDPAAGDHRLSPGSPYARAAADGTDLGADIAAIRAAMMDPF